MKFKTVRIIVCLLYMHTFVHSQTYDLLDTIFPKPQIYGVDTYSYLIKDDSLYDFLLKDIIPLKRLFALSNKYT